MTHEGEYILIAKGDLKRFENDGWSLVGQHCRPGYIGSHMDNVIVKRPLQQKPAQEINP